MQPNQQPPQPPTPQPTQPVETPSPPSQSPATPLQKPQRNNLLIAGLVATFLVLAGTAGFFGYKYFQTQPPQPSPTPLSSAAPEKESDPTANWQTYIDQAAGYSFKYPNEYIVVEDSEEYFNEQGANLPQSFIQLAGYTPPTKTSAIRIKSKDTYPIFNVWIFENPQNLSPTQWQEKYKGFYPFHWGEGDPGFTKGSTKVAGLDTEYSSIEGMVGKSTYIYLQEGQSIFLFSLLETSSSTNFANLILSTFQFTN